MPEQQNGQVPARMPQLDALRAFAVAAVVVEHALPPIRTLFPCAHSGVRLFFVLSGFLITGILLRARDQADACGESRLAAALGFYGRRALRILPLYYFIVLLGLVLQTDLTRGILPWLATFTLNIYMTIHGEWVDGFFHFWSLAVEEQFYLVWPWLILFAPRRCLLPLMLAMTLLGPLYRLDAVANQMNVIATYCLTPACLDTLGMGSLLALACHGGHLAGPGSGFLGKLVLPLGLIGVVLVRIADHSQIAWVRPVFFDLAVGLVFTWLVYSAARGFTGITGVLLECRLFVYIGRISYGIYAYHVFLPSLMPELHDFLSRHLRLDEGQLGTLEFALLGLALILTPILSWHLLERPILNLGRTLKPGRRHVAETASRKGARAPSSNGDGRHREAPVPTMKLAPPSSRLRVIVLGYIVRGPLGGLAWHHMQYMMGLAALGHDVCFVEDSDDYPGCYDPSRETMDCDPSYGLRFIAQAFARIGLAKRWAYHDAHTGRWFGSCAGTIMDQCADADLVLNLSGMNPLRPWLQEIPVRVLVDTDPVFTQVRHLTDAAARERAAGHNVFCSFGENLADGSSAIPDDGFPWQATRQPIVLEAWPVLPGPRHAKFTTVMQWDSYAACEYQGRRYGMKSNSFTPYLDLPARAGPSFELALGGAAAPRALLEAKGWALRNSLEPTRDPWTYQAYLQESKAEFSLAKHGYVVGHSGWFSERTAAYLASGRPAVVQDTGFTRWLEADAGIRAFRSPEEALAAIDDIDNRYEEHCRAAREIAAAYFDARLVLSRLLQTALATKPGKGIEADARARRQTANL